MEQILTLSVALNQFINSSLTIGRLAVSPAIIITTQCSQMRENRELPIRMQCNGPHDANNESFALLELFKVNKECAAKAEAARPMAPMWRFGCLFEAN